VFSEIKVLATIIKACLRNGSGLLPLFIADKADGDFNSNYLKLLTKEDSLFHLVLKEVRTIIRDYEVIRAVNFPEGESFRQMETKLYFQTPVLGLTGQSTKNKSNVATQFRMPGFPYALITTDIFREGEDLHTYCQHIFHYGIAWNCSDMEQRTGRIDRINSLSHRKLLSHQVLDPNTQIHVYYPYLQNTLEVNQVSRLFKSVNSFIETFNDFTQPVLENAVAYTGEAIEQMPEVIKTPLFSKFDHQNFKGDGATGQMRMANTFIGMQKEELWQQLQDVRVSLVNTFSFYYGPILDTEEFTIKGDIELSNRMKRRGPFRMIIRNNIQPGTFLLEVGAYLFKVSSKVQKQLSGNGWLGMGRFDFGTIEDFYSLTFVVPLETLNIEQLKEHLIELLCIADTIEEEITKEDYVIFT
jgi:hypothetical protein